MKILLEITFTQIFHKTLKSISHLAVTTKQINFIKRSLHFSQLNLNFVRLNKEYTELKMQQTVYLIQSYAF